MTTNVIYLDKELASQFEEALKVRDSSFCKETVFLETVESLKALEGELALLYA